MTRFNTIIILVLSVVLFSCDWIPKDTNDFAQNYIKLLRNREIEKAIELLDVNLAKQDTRWLSEVSNALNQGELKSSKIVGSNVFHMSNKTRTELTYELEYPKEWLLVEFVIEKVSDKESVVGLHTYHLKRSLEELNSFTFQGKEFIHIIFLFLAILIVGFTIFVLVVCIRTDITKKWIWIIFIIAGLGKFWINWTTGSFDFQIISFQILGAAIFKNGQYAPWILSISLPVGAIVFLFKRRKLQLLNAIKHDQIANDNLGT
ncbi:MAG: hypothetical protein EHM64_07320 [Ignavibacteriae bacterium]|nr:MAG: hypothetical protein EHM64_07320 [Ignavibacteriota bacterium]